MILLNEDNYQEVINSYSEQNWKPLIEIIPIIENVKTFGDSSEAKKLLKKGIISMDPYIEHEIVDRFRTIVYDIPIMIIFNWSAWDEGKKIASDEEFDFDTIDIPTKCKLISAIVRNDRFCSGALVSSFQSGFVLKLLKSIERQLTSKNT